MIEQTYERVVQERDMLAEAIGNAALKAGIYNGEVGLTGPHLLMLADDLAEVILNMESNLDPRQQKAIDDAVVIYREYRLPDNLVPLSADGKYVFIDGPGDIELDYNRDLEKLPEEIKRLEDRIEKLINDLATAEFGKDEDMYRALEAIIERSKNGELGTSKVTDMRKIAEKALEKVK